MVSKERVNDYGKKYLLELFRNNEFEIKEAPRSFKEAKKIL